MVAIKIDDDFIKYFLIRYRDFGTTGVNIIYKELYEDESPESQFLYEQIVYMIDCGFLKGNGIAFWGITPLGHEFIKEETEFKLLDKLKSLGQFSTSAITTASAVIELINKFWP